MATRNALIQPFRLPEAASFESFSKPMMQGVQRADRLQQQGFENDRAMTREGLAFKADRRADEDQARQADAAKAAKFGALAQVIDDDANPATRMPKWQRLVSSIPGIDGYLKQHGIDPSDHVNGPKLITSLAGKYQSAIERERAQLQNQVLRKQANAPVDDGSKIVEVNGQIVRVPRQGDAQHLYTAPGRAQQPIVKEVNGKLVSVAPDGGSAREIYGGGPENDLSKRIGGTLDELATIPGRYDSFNAGTGSLQGGDIPIISPAARMAGSVAATFNKTSPSEVRTAIDGAAETLAATIKPLIRKPGEGTWTDADQKRLDVIVGDLKRSNSPAEYNRRLTEVARRIEASFGIKLPPINFPAGPKTQGRAPAEQMPRINSDADYARIPSGAQYMAPDGTVRTKR